MELISAVGTAEVISEKKIYGFWTYWFYEETQQFLQCNQMLFDSSKSKIEWSA